MSLYGYVCKVEFRGIATFKDAAPIKSLSPALDDCLHIGALTKQHFMKVFIQ
jgi:hypothetical protein